MSDTFLKWAGGKRWFVNNESHRLPQNYNTYIEPFLGGGSVFFYLKPKDAILSDINEELINTYIAIENQAEEVYNNLKIHEQLQSKEYYYKIRDSKPSKLAESAARTIYLNKACFNGIYRVNKNGKFNVPYGKGTKLHFDKVKILGASNSLQNATILHQDFEQTINLAQNNDFIFCDPPYAVINEDNRFVSYTANTFSWNDQIRLANALQRAAQRNVKILMTNVDHPAVRQLYSDMGFFKLDTVQRSCLIAGDIKNRRKYNELIASANF